MGPDKATKIEQIWLVVRQNLRLSQPVLAFASIILLATTLTPNHAAAFSIVEASPPPNSSALLVRFLSPTKGECVISVDDRLSLRVAILIRHEIIAVLPTSGNELSDFIRFDFNSTSGRPTYSLLVALQSSGGAGAEQLISSAMVNVTKGNSLWRISNLVSGSGLNYPNIMYENLEVVKHADLIYPLDELAIPPALVTNFSFSQSH